MDAHSQPNANCPSHCGCLVKHHVAIDLHYVELHGKKLLILLTEVAKQVFLLDKNQQMQTDRDRNQSHLTPQKPVIERKPKHE